MAETRNNGDGKEAEPEAEPLRQKPVEQFELEVKQSQERCGFGCFSPSCIQRFATRQAFMTIFSILAIVQSMSWAYFTATITTLEKRFKISSQTAGIVMTGNETSQILFSIVISYYGSRGHRPRWIAVGVLFSALSCFVLSSPHLLYGAGNDALSLTEEYGNQDPLSLLNLSSGITPQRAGVRNRIQLCEPNAGAPIEFCGVGDLTIVPLVLIFVSQFVAGIGVLLFFSLGGPYLDDNIEKTQSPMLFGITMSLRLIGPILGFLLASACLKVFISPGLHPVISTDDPRWIGAWWLGWVILGSLMAVTSLFIALFPRELPEAAERRRKLRQAGVAAPRRGSHGALTIPDTPADLAKVGSQIIFPPENSGDSPLPKLSELGAALKALLKNKVNLFNNLSSVFYLFSAIGYWTYMPKYMETIFMQTAVSASAISGTVSVTFQAGGLLLSGFLISKFQPSARKLALWNVVLGLLLVLAKISFTQVGCNPGEIAHDEAADRSAWNLTTTCNSPCNCKVNKMLPVCFKEESKVFFSACHAGCSSFTNNTGTNCACLPSNQDTVTLGNCSEGCFKIFFTFLAVNAIIKFLDSSGRIGNMLVSYRCVDPKEKSLAIGLGIFLISIFSMLPAPIFFGAIFDSSCLVWGTKCGGKGNCWLYDGMKLRYAFNLAAAGFTFFGMLFDVLVWYYVEDLDLYDEDKNVRNRAKKLANASVEPTQ